MRVVCGQLRGFCLRNDWAAGASALLGVGLFFVTVWAVLTFYPLLDEWIRQNILLHGLLFGAATLADIMLIFGFLCLGFSECADADRKTTHAYRGRRSAVFPEMIHWLESLGKNPRRKPGKS